MNTRSSYTENLDFFAKFIYTDKDAVLIGKSNDFGTSLYIGDELKDLDGYYIRAENVFVKGKHLNVKYDNESKSIIISYDDDDMNVKHDNESKSIIFSYEDDEYEEPDYLYDTIGEYDAIEELENNKEVSF